MPEYNFNLNDLQSAHSGLNTLRSTVQRCRDESGDHRNRASSLAYELEKEAYTFVAGLLRGLLGDVDFTLGDAQHARRQQQAISGLLASGFGGGIPIELSSRYVEPLAQQIGSGIGALLNVLEEPENPSLWIELLQDAVRFFGEAASLINAFEGQLSHVISAIEEIISTGDRAGIAVVADIEGTIHRTLKTMSADSPSGAASAILDTGILDRIPHGLGVIPEAILQAISDHAHSPSAIKESVLDTWKEKLAGLDGGIGMALDSVSSGIGDLATLARIQAWQDSLRGPAYQAISRDLTQIVQPLDHLGDAVNDLSRAFVDMHGGTVIAVGATVLDAVVLTSAVVLAGASMGMAIPFEVAVVPAITAALTANALTIGGSLGLETLAGSNPGDVGRDFSAFGKDISAALPGAHDAANIGKDEWDLVTSGHLDGLFDIANDGSNPVIGPMLNVSATYTKTH